MGLSNIIKNINGYEHIVLHDGEVYDDVIGFSPFSGSELSGGFLWELQGKIFDKFHKMVDHSRLTCMMKEKKLCSVLFDFKDTPKEIRKLLYDRSWYAKHVKRQQLLHYDGEFCGGLSVFIDACYGVEYDPLPKLACVPIQYCPFCGVKLPPEFDQENWWEKEFKTFKWYKEHKMGEWADDYVDDCDWTEDDYPPIETK